MAAVSQSQHRCVFVGNIPYDATEEQLIQICEEAGPVVSFRLVVDRETGKPKGYGFCEYKDEETALSARRNLQGYEVNGRQLRVDFAENDKNSDKNREQGRGGPGAFANVGNDSPNQFGGPPVAVDPGVYLPLGDSVAMGAATAMAGALGFATQSLSGMDHLTQHLAKMSKSHLTEIMSEFKAMATQNKEQARQLLLAMPKLPAALFQAQIILGIVSPQMLQMPNIRQQSVPHPLAQSVPGLPPVPHNRFLLPSSQEIHLSSGVQNQYALVGQFPTQSQIQLPPPVVQNQVAQQSGPHIHMPVSLSLNHQVQQQQISTSNLGYNGQMISTHPSALMHNPSQFSADGFQSISTSTSMAMPENLNLQGHAPWQTRVVDDGMHQMNRTSKMVKLNDGSSSQAVNMSNPASGRFENSGRKIPIPEETSKQATAQVPLPPDVDSALLDQVLSLTPEQLKSLPPDQQLQVLQLQKMLRKEET